MNNQLATVNNGVEKISFTEEQISLIRQQIAPKATPAELQLFLYQAKRTGLDPLARQIYCLPIGGKMSIQTSIDGFRVVAERSGDYAGQDEPEFVENDGNIICAKVRVYRFRGEQRYLAAVGVAYMSEYRQQSPMWNKMPHTMLAKCAEALALRKAFPQDLSGLYTAEELPETTEDITATVVDTKPVGKPELKPGTKQYDLAVERLRSRTTTVTQIKDYFTLSEKVETVLATIEKAAQTPANEPAVTE